MTLEEARLILLRYRPGQGNEAEPEVAEALDMAAKDPRLAEWLAIHCLQQENLRLKLRQIAPPAALLEQIISEKNAFDRSVGLKRKWLLATAAILVFLGLFLFANHRSNPMATAEDGLDLFQKQMAGFALRGYVMDIQTNDPVPIREYLQQRQSPSGYVLPPTLTRLLAGCSVENWHSSKVTMLCFRTGNPLPPGVQSDLWLFIADAKVVKGSPINSIPQIARINRLTTATWVKDGRLYFMGTTGDKAVLQRCLGWIVVSVRQGAVQPPGMLMWLSSH